MVQVGTVLRDNDRRANGREVTITAIFTARKSKTQYAIYQSGRRRHKIRLDRIYTDDLPHRKGWSVVTVADPF